jgi:DNA-binding protein
MEKPLASAHLHEFFLSTTQRSFRELGIGDESVIDYVAAVLTEFARADRLYALRTARGRAIDGVSDMRHAADRTSAMRARAARKYVGDYTLFMTGLFRTHVESRGALGYYVEEGQRSYRAVSELDLSLFRTGFLLFEQLAKNFEDYSGALDYMRKAYFAPHAGQGQFAEFLRRVEGWITSGLSDN